MMNFHLRKRKRILKRFILTGSLFALVFFFYSLFRFIAFRFFQYDLSSNDIAALLLSVFLVALFYKPLDYLILHLFKTVLFRSHVRDLSVLGQLARASRGVPNSFELANLIVNTFGEVLDARSASVLLFSKAKGIYQIESAFGLKPSEWKNFELAGDSFLIELLKTCKIPLERGRVIHSFSWQEANQLTHCFEQLHASCIIPLMFQDELIGSINLMPKSIAKSFTSPEIKSFFEFAQEVSGAFHSAALFEELAESNEELMKIQSSFLHSNQHSAIAQLATGIAH